MNGKNNTYNTVFIYNILPCETWNAHSSNLPLLYQMTHNLYLKCTLEYHHREQTSTKILFNSTWWHTFRHVLFSRPRSRIWCFGPTQETPLCYSYVQYGSGPIKIPPRGTRDLDLHKGLWCPHILRLGIFVHNDIPC